MLYTPVHHIKELEIILSIPIYSYFNSWMNQPDRSTFDHLNCGPAGIYPVSCWECQTLNFLDWKPPLYNVSISLHNINGQCFLIKIPPRSSSSLFTGVICDQLGKMLLTMPFSSSSYSFYIYYYFNFWNNRPDRPTFNYLDRGQQAFTWCPVGHVKL